MRSCAHWTEVRVERISPPQNCGSKGQQQAAACNQSRVDEKGETEKNLCKTNFCAAKLENMLLSTMEKQKPQTSCLHLPVRVFIFVSVA